MSHIYCQNHSEALLHHDMQPSLFKQSLLRILQIGRLYLGELEMGGALALNPTLFP